MRIELIKYNEKYLSGLIKLFCETVYSLNVQDHTKEQLDIWTKIDIEKWRSRIQNNCVVLAKDGNKIVGSGELSPEGCVDMLYVHKNYLRKNVWQKLVHCLIPKAEKL